MQSTSKTAGGSKTALWTGRVISTVLVLFFIFDGVTKAIQEPHVMQAMAQGGYQPGVAMPLGITLLVCTLLYVVPKTSVLGALLLTAWLGGAVDSMVRMATPGHLFLFPVFFGVLVWLGLYLREERLKALLPFRR